LRWYQKNGRHSLPWRRNPTPYRVFIAEVMLQQTQADRVREKYEPFLKKYPNVKRLAAAVQSELLRAWSGLGYNRRALHLREAARCIKNIHGGKIPQSFDELCRLPGIGPYTAHAISIFSRNADEACVDTNVRRVLIYEFQLPKMTTDREIALLAYQVLPKGRARDWHNALMDYGALVATGKRTKISSKSQQPSFKGSRREKRGAIIRYCLEKKSVTPTAIADLLKVDRDEATELLRVLTKEKFLHFKRGWFYIKE
jgi:A/G-specific adenine glycosylase